MMKKTIQYPYFTSNEKNQVVCQFVYEDDHMVVATIERDTNNPDWQELMKAFTEEEIDAETLKYSEEQKKLAELRRENEKQLTEQAKGDALFNTKLELFDIEEIKNSKDRSLKSKIRKAKSLSEAQIYGAILVMKEMESDK